MDALIVLSRSVEDMNESLGALRRAVVALHTLLLVMFGGVALFFLAVVGAMFFLR
jgi:hypothetical protein